VSTPTYSITERTGHKWIAREAELGNGDRAWWFQLVSPELKSDAMPGTIGFHAITFEAGLMLLKGPEATLS
jgi:hypothetical protein